MCRRAGGKDAFCGYCGWKGRSLEPGGIIDARNRNKALLFEHTVLKELGAVIGSKPRQLGAYYTQLSQGLPDMPGWVFCRFSQGALCEVTELPFSPVSGHIPGELLSMLKEKVVQVRVSAELHERFREYASRKGLSRSQIITLYIQSLLALDAAGRVAQAALAADELQGEQL